jgi:hypothetical protein
MRYLPRSFLSRGGSTADVRIGMDADDHASIKQSGPMPWPEVLVVMENS